MGQVYSASKRQASTTQASLPTQASLIEEVVPSGERSKNREWVLPFRFKHTQTRPACFGDGQLRIPDRSGSDRLCSTCMSLGHLESTHWDDINTFRKKVTVKHHHSVSTLIESARGGCHLCGLFLMAWEGLCRFHQKPTGGWVGKWGFDSFSLDGDITLTFHKVKNPNAHSEVMEIIVRCGDLPSDMAGRLICEPMDSECSLFFECSLFATVNQ
jgi:hypothetical protein